MSLNESIVEDAALTWHLLRQRYGWQVGEQFCVTASLIPAFCLRPSPLRSGSQRGKESEQGKLAGHYGFTAAELDFILNYDIKYRLGRGAAVEGEE